MRAYLVVIVLAIAGCTGSAGATPAPAATALASTAPQATIEPTIAVTAPPAVAASTCITSRPAQIGTDLTPIVLAIEGMTEQQCTDSLVVKATATEFEKANPPSRLDAVPTGEPLCDRTVQGYHYRVWGTAAAEYVCAALGAQAQPS